MKYKSIFFISASVLGVMTMLAPVFADKDFSLRLKEVAAEGACPAPIPSASSTITYEGPTGSVTRNYTDPGWNTEDPGEHGTNVILEVPLGTVINYSNNVEGFSGPNRATGSSHGISRAATITSPSDLVGYYPNGYFFSRRQYVMGRTQPITSSGATIHTSGHFSCWGGFNDGETRLTITIVAEDEPPAPITKQFTTGLAVLKNPTVSLLVNGATSANVSINATPTLTWATDSVNIGESCVAANNNPNLTAPDSTWNGRKVGQTDYTPPALPGPSGGTQTVGPFTTAGTFEYSIFCEGLNDRLSSVARVQITVGNAPSYTCTINPPGSQPVQRGSSRSVTLQVNALNGYNSPVSFSLTGITSSGGTPPTVDIAGSPQSSPYSTLTTVTINTSISPPTSTGEYQINIAGSGGVNCPAIVVNVSGTNGTTDLRFDGSDGPVTLAPGNSSGTLSWEPFGDVASCTASMTQGSYPAWSGNISANGSFGVVGLLENSRYTFRIDCVTSANEPVPPDTVQVVTGPGVNGRPSFNLACTPASISLPQGSRGSYNLATTNINNFTNVVNFSNTSISPRPEVAPGITFSNNGQVPSAVTTALIDTSSATPGVYILTFEGVGGSQVKTCEVELEITTIEEPPEVRIDVQVTNDNCDTIDIAWTNPEVSPKPTVFRVYHRVSTKQPWVQVGEDVRWESGGSYKVTHSETPPLSLFSSNYYAVTAIINGVESGYSIAQPSSIIPQPCDPNSTRSDKDVIGVSGSTNKSFNAESCNGVSDVAILTNNALFSVGDRITFQINICNSGAGSLTGITVVDTLKNLSDPTPLTSTTRQSCINSQSYDSGSNTITFELADIGPGDVITQTCSVVFTATVTAPASAIASLYRFQNIANVSTNELPRFQVITPPYLFSIKGGVQNRTETAPN